MTVSPRLLALHSRSASLVIEAREDSPPLWRHLGARVGLDPPPPALAATRPRASFSPDVDRPLSVAPTWAEDRFLPILEAHRRGRRFAPRLRCGSIEASERGITIPLEDLECGIALRLRFTLDEGGAGFILTCRLTNTGAEPLSVDRLSAAVLPVHSGFETLRSFQGRHGAEFQESLDAMPNQGWLRESREGIPGHGGPPGVFVLGSGAGWHEGEVLAVQLAWSGSHRMEIARDREGFWTLTAGETFAPGEVALAPGETLESPELLVSWSGEGLNGAAQGFHDMVRRRLSWPGGRMRPRPVHLNSWEGLYFNQDEARVLALVDRAAALGVERFVLDDGWFRNRPNDRSGLGDWTTDPARYPHGLAPITSRVNELGMSFGLWVEPEMVSADSDLYRAHPDWALGASLDVLPTARRQLVLDLSRPEVSAYLFEALDALLAALPIAYLKWDHNRTLLAALPIAYLKWDHNRTLVAAGGSDGRAAYHGQVLALYALIDRLRGRHPAVEIESCAAGGGRIDAGIATRTHRFWTSDNLDALERVGIQRGFLAFMPPERMGAHVGQSPSHTTGRRQSLAFRAAVALPGHFGVELDPADLDAADTAELSDWIARYKSLRDRLHSGRTWLGEAGDGLVWQAVGEPDDLILFVYATAPPRRERPQPVRLPMMAGQDAVAVRLLTRVPGRRARLFDEMLEAPVRYSGSWLAAAGLPSPALPAESAAIFRLTAD